MAVHESYMRRCLLLATQGAGRVAPNPMVGALLVHQDRIIGEGYHKNYGGPHAEVNCLDSVSAGDKNLIRDSTLYVSLEPCVHFGKTPPCTDLIIHHRIPRVVIGCRDPFTEVNGKGIEKLGEAGVEVIEGIIEDECRQMNKRFFTYHQKKRPYVILKWAQTADFRISSGTTSRLMISNEVTNRLVHKWRTEEAAILVGTNTALLDNPELTSRLWPGPNPIRVVIDLDLKLPPELNIFNGDARTIIVNSLKNEESNNILYHRIEKKGRLVEQLLEALYHLGIQSVLVEGGAGTLQSFIEAGTWDESRVITNTQMMEKKGMISPELVHSKKVNEIFVLSDKIEIFSPS